ncbi:MAG: FeoC-like transcriptional regulator [Chloroflexi bacterium]|nr:FeoC-like transcriptional regulator [Chloroflexota bacterium]
MLLNELLRLLAEGGVHSTAEIARRLGVGPELVAAMADDLARRGYLAPLDTGCATGCDGCGLASTCAAPGSPAAVIPMLALTAKGRRAAENIGAWR